MLAAKELTLRSEMFNLLLQLKTSLVKNNKRMTRDTLNGLLGILENVMVNLFNAFYLITNVLLKTMISFIL